MGGAIDDCRVDDLTCAVNSHSVQCRKDAADEVHRSPTEVSDKIERYYGWPADCSDRVKRTRHGNVVDATAVACTQTRHLWRHSSTELQLCPWLPGVALVDCGAKPNSCSELRKRIALANSGKRSNMSPFRSAEQPARRLTDRRDRSRNLVRRQSHEGKPNAETRTRMTDMAYEVSISRRLLKRCAT